MPSARQKYANDFAGYIRAGGTEPDALAYVEALAKYKAARAERLRLDGEPAKGDKLKTPASRRAAAMRHAGVEAAERAKLDALRAKLPGSA